MEAEGLEIKMRYSTDKPRRWTISMHPSGLRTGIEGSHIPMGEQVEVVEAAELDTLRKKLAEAERQQGAMKHWAESLQVDLIRRTDERDQALKAREEAETELEKIKDHARSYGVWGDWQELPISEVIAGSFVSHCAVDVCSAANERRSHFCRRHRNLISEMAQAQAQADKLTSALRKYGRHRLGCRHSIESTRTRPCDCGWDLARSALHPTSPEGDG